MKTAPEPVAPGPQGIALALALYNTVLLLLSPLLGLKKAIKFARRGHAHEWDTARWTAPPNGKQNPKNRAARVVLVALSDGEIGILDAISRALELEFPQISIIWSIRDRGAQQRARARFPNREIVPMPFDFAVATHNWLQSVRPDALLVIEKFWWPNLVWGAKKRGAKVCLVNGRSRGREKARYRWMSGFQSWVLGAFDLLLFESEAQIERVRAVLPRSARVGATGNLKFGFLAPTAPPNAASLEKWLKRADLPLLIAGSTSPIDEKWALEAWEIVRQTTPCALLIAPRRPSRAPEVALQIEAAGHRASRRTDLDSDLDSASDSQASKGVEVLLLDTLGELATAYGLGVAAYVGGAVEGRGHNIIEPLAWGKPVAYGLRRGDFEAVQCAAEAENVGFRLASSADLADFWLQALSDPGFCREVAARAANLLNAQRGALETTVAALCEVLRDLPGAGERI